MGAIVDENQLDRVLGYIETGQRGGRDHRPRRQPGSRGDRRLLRRADGRSAVSPTRWTIAREEIFGPVRSVITFTDEEEGLRIANDIVLRPGRLGVDP